MSAHMRWLCRVVMSQGTDGAKVIAELVYGWEEQVNGATVVKGEARHRLSGPTAATSITELAARYNAENRRPSAAAEPERAKEHQALLLDPVDWKRAQGRKP